MAAWRHPPRKPAPRCFHLRANVSFCCKVRRRKHLLTHGRHGCLFMRWRSRIVAAMETVHILVVDDDLRLRDLIERYLTQQGFQVYGAAHAGAMRRELA